MSTMQLARNLALTAAGLLPFVPRRSEVRFFYGHTLAVRDVAAFRRTLRMLRSRYEFVSMRAAASLARTVDRPAGRYLAFSFDDGFSNNYELIAPTLDEVGARACFFVATAFIESEDPYRTAFLRERLGVSTDEQPMTWRMLSDLLRAGFEIGAHTVDHVDLSRLPTAAAQAQIAGAQRMIEARLGAPCDLFAWPYGTATQFPSALLPFVRGRFADVFSAIRSRETFSYGGGVINRDHFEPGWPLLHVRYFARRHVACALPGRPLSSFVV